MNISQPTVRTEYAYEPYKPLLIYGPHTMSRRNKEVENSEDKMRDTVTAWRFEGILLERYHYVPGLAAPTPKHCHQDYQIGFSLDTNGGYFYRGSTHPVPKGHFSLLHSGEVHETTRQRIWMEQPRTYWMLFIRPDYLTKTAESLYGRPTHQPFFPDPVIKDRQLAVQFLQLSSTFQRPTSMLERSSLLSICLSQFLQRHAEQRALPQLPERDHRRVQQVKDYLIDHLTENVSLSQLAQQTGLSPYRLHHVFRQEVGMALHQYQIQARITRAKQLLGQGFPLKQIAEETGFADQSHLTRQFKRFVQVTPGRYLLQK